VIQKAAAGGGGRGMRGVEKEKDIERMFTLATNEAAKAFNNPDVCLERFVREPRHIEFQILGDQHGNVVHLGERECSIQRKHQKLLEESPSDRKSTRLNSSHRCISYAVFCLKKKTNPHIRSPCTTN